MKTNIGSLVKYENFLLILILICFCVYFVLWIPQRPLLREGMDVSGSCPCANNQNEGLYDWVQDLSMNVSTLDTKINALASSHVQEATKNLPKKQFKL